MRHRRFILVGIGLWLLGELLSGPAPYPGLLISIACGAALVCAVALLFPDLRYPTISLLIATIPVRVFADELRGLATELAPGDPLWAQACTIALAILIGSRLVAALSWPLDRVTLGRPWFAEERMFVPMRRTDVWRALALTETAWHWDPRVTQVLKDMRFPSRLVIELDERAGGPRRIALRELDVQDGVFQEIETAPTPGVMHGLAPIVSLLLEETAKGTRITLTMELHNASLLRLGRMFLDAPLTGYLQHFSFVVTNRALLTGPTKQGRLAA
ncbi:MAG: hypothetical protein AAGC92_11415 [Pseudomonadota bacterium]